MLIPALLLGSAQTGVTAPVPDLVVTPERILIRPGPVLRAQSLAGAPPLSAGGVTLTYRCGLSRWGSLWGCQYTGAPSPWATAGLSRMRGYRLRTKDLTIAAAHAPPAVITVTLSPDDAIDLNVTGGVAPDPTQLVIVSQATPDEMSSFYPPSAIRAEWQPNVALTCRVLPSLEVACPAGNLVSALPPEDYLARGVQLFVFAAQQTTGQMRVAPTLKDGRPAVGYVFRTTVAFRLPES